MRTRLTAAGWMWLMCAAGVAGLVAACSGCATPAPAAAPAPGVRCMLDGELYELGGPLPSAPTWWGVWHVASGGKAGAWFASAASLRGCRA